ncbi:MAG: amidohydrolase family protein [Phycisphaerales bacterium]|nr:amidohydrolase family protein [Phycisphaerales bacterium]
MDSLFGTLLQPRSWDRCDIAPASRVTIGEDGKIAAVGAGAPAGSDAVGGEGCWILPGFIDAHLHLPQWDCRGLDGLSLFDWQKQVAYPAEERFADPDCAERVAEEFVGGMIAHGTTTVAAFGSPFPEATDRAFRVFERRGLRAVFGLMLNDMHVPERLSTPAGRALESAGALAARWHNQGGGRLQYALCPRSATCCSKELLRGVAALAESIGAHVLTHIAESEAVESAVRDMYPDLLDDVDLFAETGLLTRRTLLGHGVCLSDSLRRQVAETGAAVVHCPTANLFLECGLMDYLGERQAQIPVALGSSVGAGPEPFMPQVAVACLQTAKALKVRAIPRGSYTAPRPAEGWWLLTGGAAQALDMGDRIGALEPGYEADCLVVRPEPWIAGLAPEQQVSALLYTLRPHHIEHVYIAGRRVGP